MPSESCCFAVFKERSSAARENSCCGVATKACGLQLALPITGSSGTSGTCSRGEAQLLPASWLQLCAPLPQWLLIVAATRFQRHVAATASLLGG